MEMKTKTLEKLKTLTGKVVTITTASVNFTTEIHEITTDGIWGIHPELRAISFYLWEPIIALHEQVNFDLNNPDHLEMLKKYEEKTGDSIISELPIETTSEEPEVVEEELSESSFVDIASLAKLAKQTRKSHELRELGKKINDD